VSWISLVLEPAQHPPSYTRSIVSETHGYELSMGATMALGTLWIKYRDRREQIEQFRVRIYASGSAELQVSDSFVAVGKDSWGYTHADVAINVPTEFLKQISFSDPARRPMISLRLEGLVDDTENVNDVQLEGTSAMVSAKIIETSVRIWPQPLAPEVAPEPDPHIIQALARVEKWLFYILVVLVVLTLRSFFR
jgi:hypothetical protein